MASLLTVRLNKGDSPNWGFRLQGGIDFATPLVIQKVIVGSPAERAGLIAGDSVIKVNSTDVFNLRHKDAQDVLLRAGNALDMTIQRGGSTWKPSVVPTGTLSNTSTNINNISPVTRTSLAAKPSENIGAIGTGHNVSAKPFLNGTLNGGPKLVAQHYNSPLKLYSEESIAETLSAQTEVLSTGALGVNFKKNEKNYDASKSAVLSLLKEEEKSAKSPDHTDHHQTSAGVDTTASPVGFAGLRHVAAPENKPQPSPTPQLPPGQNICADCERLIVGVFVRIKDKNLHVECFKCSTCGTSLKNVGYYNINNKLYCDVHAKLAARNNPPAPNLVPITVPPGGRAPVNAISAALASHPYPTTAPLSPKIQSPLSGPKPFGSISAPLSPQLNYNSLPRTGAPLSPVAPISTPSYSPVSTVHSVLSNIVWPPVQEEPDLPLACPLFYPPPSQVTIKPRKRQESEQSDCEEIEEINKMDQFYRSHKFDDSSGRKSTTECVETISEVLQTQRLIESVVGEKTFSQKEERVKTPPKVEECRIEPNPPIQKQQEVPMKEISPPKMKEKDSKLPDMNDKICFPVPQKWESPLLKALTISVEEPPQDTEKTLPLVTVHEDFSREVSSEDIFSKIPEKKPSTALGSALTVAPVEPFNPVKISAFESIPLPEETEPYFPPEDLFVVPIKEEKAKPYKKKKDPHSDKFSEDLPKPQCRLSMRAALMTAPDRPFTPVSILDFEEPKISEDVETKPKRAVVPDLPKAPRNKKTDFGALENSEKENRRGGNIEMNVSHESKNIPESCRFIAKISPPENLEPHKKLIEICERDASRSCESAQNQNIERQTVETSNTCEGPAVCQMRREEETKYSSRTEKLESSTVCEMRREEETKHSTRKNKGSNVCQIRSEKENKHSIRATEDSTVCQMRKEKDAKHSSKKERKGNIVYKRPEQMISLRKPEGLPQYQIEVKQNAEADLYILERKEKMMQKSEKTKTEPISSRMPPYVQSNQNKPLETSTMTKLEENTFRPVVESRPQSVASSRPITPSMISKPPPIIPYYQSNLVAQKYGPARVNLLDPKSPGISRSPSPIMDRSRTPSQFLCEKASNIRPKSPSQGPPSNPLIGENIPNQEYFRKESAKDSLTENIPKYREILEDNQGKESRNAQRTMYSSNIITKNENLPTITIESESKLEEVAKSSGKGQTSSKFEEEKLKQSIDSQREEIRSNSDGTTKISENSHLDKLEDFKKLQSESVETSKDGCVIKRKKTVTEELEESHASKETVIESHKSGFRNVRNPEEINDHVIGLHVTSPNPIKSPFLKSKNAQPPKITTVCQKVGRDVPPLPPPKPEPIQHPILPKFDATSLPKTVSTVPTSEFPKEEEVKPPLQLKHFDAPGSSKSNQNNPNIPTSDVGAGGGRQTGAVGVAPRRGRGVLNAAQLGGRIPLCGHCHGQIRGPFITALGRIWCPNHFVCATPSCRRPLQDLGFVEENGQLYCEYCFEQYLAPNCAKCHSKIKGDCLRAIGKSFHPECFNCVHCGKLFGNTPFFLEDGDPYCETDWNEMFTTKCFACGFPVEAGDRWVEALNNNYHSQCFNCTMCKKNLEGQSFFAKGGRPYCKNHAR